MQGIQWLVNLRESLIVQSLTGNNVLGTALDSSAQTTEIEGSVKLLSQGLVPSEVSCPIASL